MGYVRPKRLCMFRARFWMYVIINK